MYRHIFMTDALCLILLGLFCGGNIALWFVFSETIFIVLAVLLAIMFIIQTFSTIYDLVDYVRDKEIEKIEKEIEYLIRRAKDAEGDF